MPRRPSAAAIRLSGFVAKAILSQAKTPGGVLGGVLGGIGTLVVMNLLDEAVPGSSTALLEAASGGTPSAKEINAPPKPKSPKPRRLKAKSTPEKVKEAVANGDVIDVEFTPL